MSIDSADVSGTIRNRIQSGAGNTDAVLDIQTKEFLVTDPYAGKGALISADASGTKLYKDDSVKLILLEQVLLSLEPCMLRHSLVMDLN